MNKILRILVLSLFVGLLLLYLIGQIILARDPISHNFPLRLDWKIHLRSNVVEISIAGDEMILVRTKASLNAINAKSGKVIWQHTLSWQADPKPAVANNGKVYVTDGDLLLSLDQETGSLLWQQPTSFSESWVTDVSNNLVTVNQLGIDIMVFDANTGEFLWRKPVCRGYVRAYTDDQNIYVPCDGLEAIDVGSGETSWRENVGVLGDIGYSGDIAYYFSNSVDAYDLQSQKRLWSTPLPNTGLESFKIVENALFYTDAARLCMLDIGSGQLKWCIKTPYPQSPAVIENNVYTFDGSHKTVMAIQISDGEEIGMLNLSNFNYFIINRQLLVATSDKLFFADGKNIYAYTN